MYLCKKLYFSTNTMLKSALTIILTAACSLLAQAQTAVRFGNEASDTTLINNLLTSRGASQPFANPEARVAFFAESFTGTPYGAHTLEGDPEILTVRLDSLECTTFVETAMALACTTMESRSSWRDFVYNLEHLRYRGGEVNGYPSRLHYISDWIVDNRHRGILTEVTDKFPRVAYQMRTLDFMTSNRDKYPALADSANYTRLRDLENGYRQHRFPYIKSGDLALKQTKAALRNGDVVALVSNLKNLDVTHMGIIVKENPSAEPYLLHASSSHGKVEVTSLPLAEFMKKNRQWIGIRVIRLNQH